MKLTNLLEFYQNHKKCNLLQFSTAKTFSELKFWKEEQKVFQNVKTERPETSEKEQVIATRPKAFTYKQNFLEEIKELKGTEKTALENNNFDRFVDC